MNGPPLPSNSSRSMRRRVKGACLIDIPGYRSLTRWRRVRRCPASGQPLPLQTVATPTAACVLRKTPIWLRDSRAFLSFRRWVGISRPRRRAIYAPILPLSNAAALASCSSNRISLRATQLRPISLTPPPVRRRPLQVARKAGAARLPSQHSGEEPAVGTARPLQPPRNDTGPVIKSTEADGPRHLRRSTRSPPHGTSPVGP